MKNLKTLFNCGIDVLIGGIQINSKQVKKGDLFICRKGINSDAHDFVFEAIQKGAIAIVCSKNLKVNVPIIKVDDVNESIPKIMDWFYGIPNEKFKNIIGVTGTAGKTSVCNIINKILNDVDSSACIGTNGIHSKKYNLEDFDVPNTTYPINKYYEIIEKLKVTGVNNLIIETSSYGLKQNRLGNTKFDIAIVTNFSKAHLAEHDGLKDYLDSKLKIVDKIKKDGYLILNADDKMNYEFSKLCSSKVITYGKNINADLCFKDVSYNLNSTSFSIVYKNKEYNVKTKLLGVNNIYNICSSFLACTLLGYKIEDCIASVANLYIEGRMENYKGFIIDFAVTTQALETNLKFLNENKKDRIISVIGRMEGKESLEYEAFGNISTKYSDYVIFTTDRNKTGVSEAAEKMTLNLNKANYEIIYDRKDAIKKAINIKGENDIIYIVGSEYFYKSNGEEYVNPYEIIDRFCYKIL